MKKILIFAAFFISTGVITSCSKENNVTPVTKSISSVDQEDLECGACLATGDGGVDRPTPPKKP